MASSMSAFNRLIFINSVTKLADLCISAKTTLPWLLMQLGAPAWVVSLLVPIRESGSMLPQWWLKNATNHIAARHNLWRYGASIQGISLAVIALLCWQTTHTLLGVGVLLCLGIFSLGRALCSLTMKEIQGELINKGQRGKLVGTATSVSAALTFMVGTFLFYQQQSMSVTSVIMIVVVAAMLFMFALILMSPLSIKLATQESSQNPFKLLKLVVANKALKHLVISRSLALHAALVAPYFIALSTSAEQQNSVQTIALFLMASALAALLSGYIWGVLSDKSAKRCIQIALLLSCVACGVFYLCLDNASLGLNAFMFFLLSVGHAGIRVGRKTYILDIAEGEQRSQFVASANTLVGLVLLVTGALYAAIYAWINHYIILLMLVILGLALLHSQYLSNNR
jgi:Na+/melibiose symporter-like transporter